MHTKPGSLLKKQVAVRTFTRARAYHKDDQAHVEQKNWSVVRRLIGYDRAGPFHGPWCRCTSAWAIAKRHDFERC